MSEDIYIQSSDPGAVGFGKEWRNSSNGNIYIRNTSNTAWTLIGNADSIYLGNLSAGGGVVTGVFNGPTGWAPLASPDFTGSCTINSVNAATVNDLSSVRSELLANMDALISEAMATYGSSASTSDILASDSGVLTVADWDVPFTLPTIQFSSDGVIADSSNSTISLLVNSSAGDFITVYRDETDSTDVVPGENGVFTFLAYYADNRTGTPVKTKVDIRYLIIATRNTEQA